MIKKDKIMNCKIINTLWTGSGGYSFNYKCLRLCLTTREQTWVASRGLSDVSKPSYRPWNVLFFGTDSFSVESLEALNVNRLRGSPKVVGNLDVVSVPRKGAPVPVHRYVSENKLTLHEWPYRVPPATYDLGIVASFGHLIPEEIITAFPLGMINVHGSLLPRWRGAAPVIHAILNDDKMTGATIMEIAPHRFDVGKIFLQQSFDMPRKAMAGSLTQKIATTGAQLLIECLKDLENVLKNGRPQDPNLVTNAPKIKSGMARIVWQTHSILEIDKLYRALDDSLKVFTYWRTLLVRLSDMVDWEDTLQLVQTEPKRFGGASVSFLPGKVLFHKRRKSLFILCKDGWVEFRSVMAKGKAKMTATEFYNGYVSKVQPELQQFTSEKIIE